MDVDDARRLLKQSYHLSATRILQVLDGSFAVRNSREPSAPPSTFGEVVGLCGQSGRHLYFRIPEQILRTAAQDISSALDVEQVAAICQRLRRQTVFDDRSGCVNDRLPAIVPLLPPEEIWLDGKELPLDIWRLLSFDVDLVSSALSAHVPLDDIAFGSLTQGGLAFRLLMSRMQTQRISFDVVGQN